MKAKTAAIRLAEKHGTRNPFEICQNEGITVIRHPLGDIRGYFRRTKVGYIIVINSCLEGLPAMFACGHELGHWAFDRGMNRVFMDCYTHFLPERMETRADRFAAQLMFGEPPLYQEPITAQEMAEILNVPISVVDERLLEFEIYY